jgi:hypothetical protein
MAGSGEQEVPTVAEAETLADFLANLGTALFEQENVDVSFANIVAAVTYGMTPVSGAGTTDGHRL